MPWIAGIRRSSSTFLGLTTSGEAICAMCVTSSIVVPYAPETAMPGTWTISSLSRDSAKAFLSFMAEEGDRTVVRILGDEG